MAREIINLTKSFYPISDADTMRKTTTVKQLVDILSIDIAGRNEDGASLNTRRKYEVFVTGGIDDLSPVTSSLFQTVFDQDYETQTSNELLDITIGCYHGGDLVQSTLDKTQGLEDEENSGQFTGIDASGKYLFANDTLMMREKINIYKQYAKYLLGNSEEYFTSPFNEDFTHVDNSDQLTYRERIDEAIFINLKRLFVRDALDKEQFALTFFKDAHNTVSGSNINIVSNSTNINAVTDNGAKNNLRITTICGAVGTLKKDNPSAGEDENVGLIFYDKGIVVLDAKKIFDPDQSISGSISAVTGTEPAFSPTASTLDFDGSLIPNFWVSGSIDNIIDHICESRFTRDFSTALGFINETYINSSIYICRVGPSQANYSRNPTYKKEDGSIRVISNPGDDPFSYITTVGLYDGSNSLLAIAKTSRPIEKNPEVDLSISIRIDY